MDKQIAFVTEDGETVYMDDLRALHRHDPLKGAVVIPAARAAMLNKHNRLRRKHAKGRGAR